MIKDDTNFDLDNNIQLEGIQLEPCHCEFCDIRRKEFLISKLKDKMAVSGVFDFHPDGSIIWKNSCPACGGDMNFSFGDLVEEYAMGTREIEYEAFCSNKNCCGHIDNCGWIC